VIAWLLRLFGKKEVPPVDAQACAAYAASLSRAQAEELIRRIHEGNPGPDPILEGLSRGLDRLCEEEP